MLSQPIILVQHGELRELGDNISRRAEQDACIGYAKHGCVVIRIAHGNNSKVKALERRHRLALAIDLA